MCSIGDYLVVSLIVKGLVYCFFSFYLLFSVLAHHRSESFFGLLAVLGLFAFKDLGGKLKKDPLGYYERRLVWCFAAYSVISLSVYLYWPFSGSSNLRVLDDLKFFVLIPFFLLLRGYTLNVRWFGVIFAVFAVLMGLISIGQYLNVELITSFYPHSSRPSADVNPMRYAVVALLMACFGINYWLAFKSKSILLKICLMTSILFGLIACVLTQTRGVWLAIPLLSLVYCGYLFQLGSIKRLMIAMLAVFTLLCFSFQSVFVQNRLDHTVKNIERYQNGDKGSSLAVRLDMFKVSLLMVQEKPLLGHGLGVFKVKSKEIRESGRIGDGVHRQVGIRKTPHNEFFQALVERGVVGLFVTFLLFLVPGIIFYRALRQVSESTVFYGLSGMTLLLVFAVAGQTGTLFNHNLFTNFYIIMVLLFVSQIRRGSPRVLG